MPTVTNRRAIGAAIGTIAVTAAVTNGQLPLSNAPDCMPADNHSSTPMLSADALICAFHSLATNLAPNDANGTYNVFYRMADSNANGILDDDCGSMGRVDLDSPDIRPGICVAGDAIYQQRMSGNGDWLFIGVRCPMSLPPNEHSRLFAFERSTSELTLISVSSEGESADGPVGQHASSHDGRWVVLASSATNLTSDLLTGQVFFNLWLIDRDADDDGVFDESEPGARDATLLTQGTDGSGANANVTDPWMSASGRFVVFETRATNLVGGFEECGTSCRHIMLLDRDADGNGLFDGEPSIRVITTGSNGDSNTPRIAANGRYVAFFSSATNLVAGDTNLATDIFVYDVATEEIVRVSVTSLGEQVAFGVDDRPHDKLAISADGRRIAFGYQSADLDGPTGGWAMFVHDRDADQDGQFDETGLGARTTTIVSRASDGTVPALVNARHPSFGATGEYLALAIATVEAPIAANAPKNQFNIVMYNVPEATCFSPCNWDTGDRAIDVSDLLKFLDVWFGELNGVFVGQGITGGDYDASGIVDVLDLLAFLSCWYAASAEQPCQ